MKDAWPVEAEASGGRHYRGDCDRSELRHYSVEYTFADGTKFFLEGRNIEGCQNEFASYAHGTKGAAMISTSSHCPAKSPHLQGPEVAKEDIVWNGPDKEPDPYQLEWERPDGRDSPGQAVQRGQARRGGEPGHVDGPDGRPHRARSITFEQMLNHDHEFAPDVDKLTMDSPAPLPADKDGKYPVPQPGITKKREYA